MTASVRAKPMRALVEVRLAGGRFLDGPRPSRSLVWEKAPDDGDGNSAPIRKSPGAAPGAVKKEAAVDRSMPEAMWPPNGCLWEYQGTGGGAGKRLMVFDKGR